MKAFTSGCFLVSCLFYSVFAVAQANCGLHRLAMRPEKVLGSYVGREKSTQVALVAEHPVGAMPLFNQPLVVKLDGSDKDCRLGEGIWDQDRIYLSADARTLAAVESSGSSSDFSLFDLNSCRKIGRIDVSGLGYQIIPDRVIYQGVCEYTRDDKSLGSCSPAAVYALSPDCRPSRMERESLDLTKKNFGVAFSESSEVEFPHSPKARLVPKAK